MTRTMRLLENPRVYRLWQMPFAEAKFAPVRRHGEPAAAKRVLDIGCGPGTNASFFSESDYLGLDINPKYIEQAKRRFGDRFIVADVTRDELPEWEPFDFVLVNSLLHHLDTHDVRKLLAAVARHLDADGHVHILDLVQPKRPGVARLLARLDRGDFRAPSPIGRRCSRRPSSPLSSSPSTPAQAGALEHGVLQGQGTAMTTSPRISVAIALLNEEQVIPELVRRLSDVLDAIPGGPHEVVFVDDGSSDSTFELIAAAAERDPRIVGLSLSRNFGHQAALSAGLESATGDVVVLMDGDLQDPPEEIPKFLVAYEDGFDVVYAQRVNRKEGWVLRLCDFLFYRLIAALATVRLPVDSGDFALLSRPVVDH